MQVEIPEGTHIHIVVGNPARAFACPGLDPPAALPVLAEAAGGGRATLRLLLKSSLVVLLVAGSFALGHYGGATPAPELTRSGCRTRRRSSTVPRRPGRGRRPGPGRVSAAIAAAALGHTATAITAAGHIRPKPVRPGEMMVARQIVGPQEQYERNGVQRLRGHPAPHRPPLRGGRRGAPPPGSCWASPRLAPSSSRQSSIWRCRRRPSTRCGC